MVASDQSARPAWAGGVDGEQLQQSGRQRRWLGNGWWVVPTSRVEPKPGQGFEDQPAGWLGRTADVQPGQFHGRGDGLADGPLDQAEDQQRQADHTDQGADAPVVFEKHRGDGKGALEGAVAALHDLLALVASQDLAGISLVDPKVGQQPIPAIAGGVGVQGGLVEGPGKGRLAGGGVGADLGA